ncbi:YdaU family protein [Acidithiobacillus albertensis]|uniref:YdaU family protein n=1 Tax=Acidithiobacillus albertensis TaxID=119978 RepID=UPI001C070887|nr:YdaU family protein [Acidithiobacillus albertensis]MBU2741466.1 YdaU family protein [Acidithiobacillus albertensis]
MPAMEPPILQEPLTPKDCDLRSCPSMPVDIRWLMDSEMVVNTNGEAFRAAMLLILASWHQLPAGSLPNDDKQLGLLAGYGRFFKAFQKVKESALQDWILCSDNRWYHPEIAEVVLRVWTEKLAAHEIKAKRSKIAQVAANARWSSLQTVDAAFTEDATGKVGPDLQRKNVHKAMEVAASLPALPALPTMVKQVPLIPDEESVSGTTVTDVPMTANQPAASISQGGNHEGRKKSTPASKKQALRETLLAVDLPEWLSATLWEQYVDFRFEMGKPLTVKARDMAIQKLARLRAEGNDPVEVIETAMVAGWMGLFAVRNRNSGMAHRGSLPSSGHAEIKEGSFSAVTRL